MTFLLILSVVGVLTSSVYTGLVVVGAARLAARRRAGMPLDFLPSVSLLKPLHGLEPDLAAHLESFFQQDYPGFEVIFCARHEQDAGRRLRTPVNRAWCGWT